MRNGKSGRDGSSREEKRYGMGEGEGEIEGMIRDGQELQNSVRSKKWKWKRSTASGGPAYDVAAAREARFV